MLHLNQKKSPSPHQEGAVLLIGLIMLLLMSIIGLAAVRGTNLQELMAGNARDKQIAFQAAETALRKAELVVDGQNPPNIGTDIGMINQAATGASSEYWRNGFAWDPVSGVQKTVEVNDALEFVQAKPRYVVEKLNVTYIPGSDGRAADWLGVLAAPEISVYRVTSKGVGLTEKSIVYLQSVYRRQ